MENSPKKHLSKLLEREARIDILIAKANLAEARYRAEEAKSNAEEARFRAQHTQTVTRPSRLYPVVLLNDGLEWVCRLTGHNDPSRDLTGTGTSPENAMIAFDMAWYGTINE